MNQDEIIEMARQARLHRNQHNLASNPVQYRFSYDGTEEELIAFAKLVAAKEREACEKECQEQFDLAMSANEKAKLARDKNAYLNSAVGSRFCLLRIRARGEA